LNAVEIEVLKMEAELEAMRLLTYRAAWMGDNARPNSLEASISKAKCGRMGSKITQRCVVRPNGFQDYSTLCCALRTYWLFERNACRKMDA
jgi:hypothetical protein